MLQQGRSHTVQVFLREHVPQHYDLSQVPFLHDSVEPELPSDTSLSLEEVDEDIEAFNHSPDLLEVTREYDWRGRLPEEWNREWLRVGAVFSLSRPETTEKRPS